MSSILKYFIFVCAKIEKKRFFLLKHQDLTNESFLKLNHWNCAQKCIVFTLHKISFEHDWNVNIVALLWLAFSNGGNSFLFLFVFVGVFDVNPLRNHKWCHVAECVIVFWTHWSNGSVRIASFAFVSLAGRFLFLVQWTFVGSTCQTNCAISYRKMMTENCFFR